MVLSEPRSLTLRNAMAIAAVAVVSFHLAYEVPALAWLMGVFAYALVRITEVGSTRKAFYLGLATGLAIYVPQLWFFAGIFKAAAIALWLIIALWLAVFLLIVRACRQQLPRWVAAAATPVVWMGLEYFRSELYYLRFAWLNVGYAFTKAGPLLWPGVYGIGFLVFATVAILQLVPEKLRTFTGVILLGALAALTIVGAIPSKTYVNGPFVVGVQLEHPWQRQILESLDAALTRYPDADLLMLSEYSLTTPPPPWLCDWCRDHQKHLLVGGVQPLPDGRYHNTAFVVGPDGRILFRQAKSVPIQFFTDGLPASSQELWLSPWGPIGICICYDLSYTRVTDSLIRQGAGAILVPTMDLVSWGSREHALHARVGPARAAEYRVPIVRVCSSGVSQIINADGDVTSTAGFPGQGEMVAGVLPIQSRGRLPLDRYLAPACSGLTGLLVVVLAVDSLRRRHRAAISHGPPFDTVSAGSGGGRRNG